MRFGLAVGLVLAVLLGALAWLARSSARGQVTRTAAREAEAREVAEPELVAPEVPAEASEAPKIEGERDPSARGRSFAERAPKAEAPAAPVRGRVVVAETGDPIEAVLDLRLRTNDLLRSEDLRTLPDGSFEGQTLFRRSVLLALVKTEEGRELVDQEALFDPRAEGEWLVKVPERVWPTFARGTVVDRRGEALEGAVVKLVPLAPELQPADDESDTDGSVHLRPLRPGRYRLHVDGRWARAEPVELALRAGPNELGLLVVPEPAPGGDLVLTIAADAPGVPACEFELTDLAGGAAGRRQRFDSTLGHVMEGGKLWLVVAGLPAGRYALAVRSLDGRICEPASLRFSPPARLELSAKGAGHPGHTFRARDARTGEPLLGFTVFGRKGRTWRCQTAVREERVQGIIIGTRSVRIAEVHLAPGFDSWVVSARGFRATLGTFAAAGETLEVALEPGWSELYQFEDANGDAFAPPELQRFLEPPVLEGVEVLADGVLAGTSDADGFCWLSSDAEPASIEFRKPGWFPVDQYRLDILRTIELAQSP